MKFMGRPLQHGMALHQLKMGLKILRTHIVIIRVTPFERSGIFLFYHHSGLSLIDRICKVGPDGCEQRESESHADDHPNPSATDIEVINQTEIILLLCYPAERRSHGKKSSLCHGYYL